MTSGKPGTLFVIATPIGNREDITLRALNILRDADLVACEDTRRTGLLLQHFQIKRKLVSYHDFNEEDRAGFLGRLLQEGRQVALVTDAGTPSVSDPGHRLLIACAAAGIPVVPIPGPSALTAALSISHLPVDRFFFAGFPPARASQRRRLLAELVGLPETVVFFEAPHRFLALVKDLLEIFGEREALLCRELTKLHEEVLRLSLTELLREMTARPKVKGEITLLVAAAEGPAGKISLKTGSPEPLSKEGPTTETGGIQPEIVWLEYLDLRRRGLLRKEILACLGRKFRLRRNELYHFLLEREDRSSESGPDQANR